MFTGDRTLTFATNGSIAIPYFKLRSQAILLTFTKLKSDYSLLQSSDF
ncbi:MAG: hypothetical protein JGK24_30215 [Microcoleus sp. PH2017_29_MFU_D_A]|nr:hypothetical protein [Microcoleus sp. PH2017_29_MFU_D_A]MCC3607387.1 hypothetical protein [Microcoleus sp. PH2017_29_MFU_D_A]